MTAVTIAQVAAVLRSQLGVTEQPFGSNRTPYGAWYGWNGVAWCDIFQSWAFGQLGALDAIGGKFAGTVLHSEHYQRAGAWSKTPRVGAHCFFDWGSGIAHIGWVESLLPGGAFVAIEGNTDVKGGGSGGRVMRQRRTTVGARGGFGMPAYAGVGTAPVRAVSSVAAPSLVPTCPGVTRQGQGVQPAAPSPVTRAYQQRLRDRGWAIDVDGRHGPGTSDVLRRFQAQKGLTADGVGGPATWAALWTEAVTR